MSSGYFDGSPLAIIARFIDHKREEDKEKGRIKRADEKDRHFAMFPALPKKQLVSFCERKVFKATYLFIGNIQKGGIRQAICGGCGHTYSVDRSVRHNKTVLICPKCKREVRACAMRYAMGTEDKSMLLIPYKKSGQLLFRWVDVYRKFRNYKPEYSFEDYQYVLNLKNKRGKEKEYVYRFYYSSYYWGYDWHRQDWGFDDKEAYLYTSKLKQVFPQKIGYVDIARAMKQCNRPVKFMRLLQNMKEFPITEYFIKRGLYAFAMSDLSAFKHKTAGSIHEFLGVGKEYLPSFSTMDITPREVAFVRQSKTYLNMDYLVKLRKISSQILSTNSSTINDLRKLMGVKKFLTYFAKQAELNHKNGSYRIFDWYKDYLGMCKELNITVDSKRLRFPTDIRIAHNRLSDRLREIQLAKAKEKMEEINRVIKQYFNLSAFDGSKDLCIKMPESQADFVRESEVLGHCVGRYSSYFEDHVAGKKLILFIRKKTDPEKPYYTMELYMKDYSVGQVEGKARSRSKAVRKLAEDFAQYLKDQDMERYSDAA